MVVGFCKQSVFYLCLVAVVGVSVASVSIFSGTSNAAFAATVTADITPGSTPKTTDAYSPNPINANVGDTVTWTNKDTTIHTVTSGSDGTPDGKFDSSDGGKTYLAGGQTFSHTFDVAGEYPYYCILHTAMVGKVVVAGPGPSNSTNSSNSTSSSQNTTNSAAYFDREFADGLTRPTSMAFSPDGRLFVNEQGGNLRVIKNGTLLEEPFLTVSVNSFTERGLNGIAFDPEFEDNGYVYVYYTTSSDPVHNRLSRFVADASNPDVAAADSEEIILDLEELNESLHHNGGALNFGNDGKLYVGVGYNTNDTNPQSLATRLGKILRINPDGSIPSDNPFVNTTGAKGEIWALGLRNPFTGAMKQGTNTLYINDVGLATWEEINAVEKGGNYGWRICEGPCSEPDLIDPIYAYEHPGEIRRVIAGGTFYEGTQFPEQYEGSYFFGDFLGNYIKALTPDNEAIDFLSNVTTPVDIDVGPDGSLYYLSYLEGAVHKVTYATEPPPPPSDEPPDEPPVEPPTLPPGEPPGEPPSDEPPVEPPSPTTNISTVYATLDGRRYLVEAESATVKVTAATIEANKTVTVFVNGSGEVKLKLQKVMIDGISTIMADSEAIPFRTVESTSANTTIEFSVPIGVNSVEITGTTVVPEFGMVAVLVLAVSLVALIGIARFRGSSLGFRHSATN